MTSVCLNCGVSSEDEPFPLGRPRKDGTRGLMAYCTDCFIDRGSGLRGGGKEALNRARRNWRRRTAYAAWGYRA